MHFLHGQPDTDVLIEEDVLTETDLGAVLMVYNDDVNTFEWVITSLMEVCGHTAEQAEQCSLFIHFKGKYGVKTGSREELEPMKDALHDRGISAAVIDMN
jgi:ATP-dependent Clp protease adaptor protein ClpS